MTLENSRKCRYVAVIGSGPAGFYATEALLAVDHVHVDLFDRLPTPFGLVRAGIAPDHQRTKLVTRVFDQIANKPRFRFFGNVEIGRHLGIEELRLHYDAVVLAHGAMDDRRLDIPGESIGGCLPATAFVAWYNGHPDFADLSVDLSHETAVVIGVGNVAADIARILLGSLDLLSRTDIAEHALQCLRNSRVRTVYIVGRRQMAEARFTSPELQELGRLADVETSVDHQDLPQSAALESLTERERRNLQIFRGFNAGDAQSAGRRLRFRFGMEPVSIHGADRVTGISFNKRRADERVTIPCGLVIRSIGNKGCPISGVPFDATSCNIPHCEGRVVGSSGVMSGLYVAGWAKRGPSGTVGTNRLDSQETCKALLADLRDLPMRRSEDPAIILRRLHSAGHNICTYADWHLIDADEIARGRGVKPREKFVRTAEMLACLKGPQRGVPDGRARMVAEKGGQRIEQHN